MDLALVQTRHQSNRRSRLKVIAHCSAAAASDTSSWRKTHHPSVIAICYGYVVRRIWKYWEGKLFGHLLSKCKCSRYCLSFLHVSRPSSPEKNPHVPETNTRTAPLPVQLTLFIFQWSGCIYRSYYSMNMCQIDGPSWLPFWEHVQTTHRISCDSTNCVSQNV